MKRAVSLPMMPYLPIELPRRSERLGRIQGWSLIDTLLSCIYPAFIVPLHGTMVGALLFYSQTTGALLAIVFAVYFVYQAWRFGAQNIGVASFISLSDRGSTTRFF